MADYWRDEFDGLAASVGGAAFKVEAATTQLGRRTVIQRFPNTDQVRVQDLGPEADGFDVTGYIVGRDYHRQRRALEDVFREPGPYLLVHPFRGRFLVGVEGGIKITESRTRLGYADIAFRCVKHSEMLTPGEDFDQLLNDVIAEGETSTRASLASSMDVSERRRPKLLAEVAKAQATIRGTLAVALTTVEDAGRDVVREVDALTSSVQAVISTPADIVTVIADTVRSVITAPLTLEASAVLSLGAFKDALKFEGVLDACRRYVDRDGTTGLRPLAPGCFADDADPDVRNAQVITALLRTEAMYGIAAMLRSTAPDTRELAQRSLVVLSELLSGVGGRDPDALTVCLSADDVIALDAVKAASARFIRAKYLGLPTLRTYTVPAPRPLLLIAQELLGDPARWTELADRNEIANPFVVPAGTVLEYVA